MKNILYVGQFKDACGYGNAARNYLKILDKFLDKSKFNLKIFPLNLEKKDFSSSSDKELFLKYSLGMDEIDDYVKNNKYIALMHLMPTLINLPYQDLKINLNVILKNKNCLRRINMISWETDSVPESWKEVYKNNFYDEIVVSCKWNLETFSRELPLKITYAPLATYDYYDLNKKTNKEKFRIFSMSQWTHRKGFDKLLKAYFQEFFHQEDVELFIKTYRAETLKNTNEDLEKKIIIEEIKKIKQLCSDDRQPSCKVLVQTNFCSREEIKTFYENSDVFCLLTRGEGFGLTISQAALSGVPCIIPDKGGHLDFLDKQNNYFVYSIFEPVENLPTHIYCPRYMNFVEPSLLSAKQQLRKAYNDWKDGKLKEKSLKVKEYSQNYLSEENIFQALKEIIS